MKLLSGIPFFLSLLVLNIVMVGGIFFVGRQNACPSLLLAGNSRSRVGIIIQNRLIDGKYFDLGSSSFPVIFNLQRGQEIIPFFMGKGSIVLLFFIHFILH